MSLRWYIWGGHNNICGGCSNFLGMFTNICGSAFVNKIIHQMSLIKGVIIIPAISKFTKVHDRTITCKCVTKLLLDLKPTKAAGPIN